MKKLTDFIIEKRYFILGFFIILTIICGFLKSQVNINYDISKYLPDSSETRHGLDIMEREFKEESSSFNLMFKGLKESEKDKIYNYLKDVDNVSSVDYKNTDKYNKKNATLYVINVDSKADSKKASTVFNTIVKHYKDYDIYTSGEISERNVSVLPTWIVVIAVLSALVILLIMCESYVEPFLFLTAILMGVVLNAGTNVMFKSVSNITSSICAILQMALSMDYSIMLINRYRQEREKETDKVKAMKKTMHKAFTSICSSSVTTIVGLLVLVFMSFKIGRDLGFVLAKGVMFSLICILFVLPALILIFDKAIQKTKKKAPHINLTKMGKISYKLRYVSVPVFLLIFVLSFLEKGNLGILYTDTQSDEVSKVFEPNNQIALIYKNKDEKKVSKYLKNLEQENKVNQVLGYSNTIGDKLKYNELKPRFKDLDQEVDVDEFLLKIIYYNYYNKDEENKMTFPEFIKFIKTEVYNNDKISSHIDSNMKNNIERLENFTNQNLFNKELTIREISEIMGIDEDSVKDIITYYNSKNNNIKLSINEFINFMNSNVLNNNKYMSSVSNKEKEDLKRVEKFTNKDLILKDMTSNELANLFGIDNKSMNLLLTYYYSLNKDLDSMTLKQFSDFILTDVITDESYKNLFNESTINNIKMLNTFSNKDIITKQMNYQELSNLFGLEEDDTKKILLMKYKDIDTGKKIKLIDLYNSILALRKNPLLQGVDLSMLDMIDMNMIPDTKKNNYYTASELSTLIKQMTGYEVKEELINIYAVVLYSNNDINDWTLSPTEFINFILANIDTPLLKNSLNNNTLQKLNLLNNITSSSLNNTSYTYSEISKVIGVDSTTCKNIYLLSSSKTNKNKLSPYKLVKFILNNKDDSKLKNSINKDMINELNIVNKVMDGMFNNKSYSSFELSQLLGINKDNLDLIYGLYMTEHNNRKVSLKNFVYFTVDNVMNNPKFTNNFDSTSRNKMNTVKGIINASINNTKYTKNELFGIISMLEDNVSKSDLDLVYMYYGSSREYNNSWSMTVEEFVNYVNDTILKDKRFDDFVSDDIRNSVNSAKKSIKSAKKLLVGSNYSRIILNTNFEPESKETFNFINKLKKEFKDTSYVIGDSPMALEMSKTFNDELNNITILTIIAILIVVAITFKSIIIPIILVLTIQCAVFLTMGILSVSGESVYFISILIVQSILMGATIDYAILYTSYYLEHRKKMGIKESIISSYNKSINTILTSALILSIVTLIVGHFASAIAAKICKTLSEGTICSSLLILILLPAVIAAFDKFAIKKKNRLN